jgi:hypothetical protein
MKVKHLLSQMLLAFATAAVAFAQTGTAGPLKSNQTAGFGDGQLLTFTYLQSYGCVDEPFSDLNHNGTVAAEDPAEFQKPICVVGQQSSIDPAGQKVKDTEKLWILVPFFDADHDNEAFTPELRDALISLFGFVPDAFDPHPGVPVQCPEPGPPATQQTGAPGTCTMHASTVDLGPVLASLGKVPPNTNVFVPTPNHSHILEKIDESPVWWQIITVLVTDQNAWPGADGKTGINSLKALRAAQAKGQALGDVPTNFFLFFGSQPAHH